MSPASLSTPGLGLSPSRANMTMEVGEGLDYEGLTPRELIKIQEEFQAESEPIEWVGAMGSTTKAPAHFVKPQGRGRGAGRMEVGVGLWGKAGASRGKFQWRK